MALTPETKPFSVVNEPHGIDKLFAKLPTPGEVRNHVGPFPPDDIIYFVPTGKHYRFVDGVSRRVFWPLEQIDRQLRPRQ